MKPLAIIMLVGFAALAACGQRQVSWDDQAVNAGPSVKRRVQFMSENPLSQPYRSSGPIKGQLPNPGEKDTSLFIFYVQASSDSEAVSGITSLLTAYPKPDDWSVAAKQVTFQSYFEPRSRGKVNVQGDGHFIIRPVTDLDK